jgi:ABC-type antimicrobial peptide transport system permease subunit
MIVTVKDGAAAAALRAIREVVATFDARHPFEYAFLADLIDQQYASETVTMRLTGLFSVVCILISCLGLFGLAALTTQQRTKEIGIRKVLGASSTSIVVLLSRGLLVLVIAAACAASVATYLVMQSWLETFVYRTDIHLGIFFSATLVTAVLALLAVASQAGKSARQDPIVALRYE